MQSNEVKCYHLIAESDTIEASCTPSVKAMQDAGQTIENL